MSKLRRRSYHSISNPCRAVSVSDYFSNCARGITFPVDDNAVYMPDAAWSRTFAQGLEKLEYAGAHVIELGVGSGINMVGLMCRANAPQSYIGLDIAHEAVEASQRLATQLELRNTKLYQSDLLTNVSQAELAKATHVVGCIPQVPVVLSDIKTERNLSDYYVSTGAKEDESGLGLIARALDQVQQLAPTATVVLNIAGRPGKERVAQLFQDRGYAYKPMHEVIVQQDAGTALLSLAALENRGKNKFEFFSDKGGASTISATEAECLRQRGQPIYHRLSVIKAQSTKAQYG